MIFIRTHLGSILVRCLSVIYASDVRALRPSKGFLLKSDYIRIRENVTLTEITMSAFWFITVIPGETSFLSLGRVGSYLHQTKTRGYLKTVESSTSPMHLGTASSSKDQEGSNIDSREVFLDYPA